MACQQELREAGKTYPRTCPDCGLGHCKHPHAEPQPEALWLADWCDAHSSGIYRPSAQAATVLREQHEAITRFKAQVERLMQERDESRAANAYMLEQVAKYGALIAELEAKIDALMLEFCPEDMTPEQRANWASHQSAAQAGLREWHEETQARTAESSEPSRSHHAP
jgi:hypothetical protein